MRLTYFTDYALRVLIMLAVKPDALVTIREIAERFRISENHLTKVAHLLGRDGYVETVRGRNGGLRLAMAPEAINVGAIVRRYEDDLALVECFDRARNTCPIAPVCALSGAIGEALDAFLKVLDGKTLADIAANRGELARSLAAPPTASRKRARPATTRLAH